MFFWKGAKGIMKKKYEKPSVDISTFFAEDIIALSGVTANIIGDKYVQGASVYSSKWKDAWND